MEVDITGKYKLVVAVPMSTERVMFFFRRKRWRDVYIGVRDTFVTVFLFIALQNKTYFDEL